MIVHVVHKNYYWRYWYIGTDGVKTTVEAFETHIKAQHHAKEKLGADITFVYK